MKSDSFSCEAAAAPPAMLTCLACVGSRLLGEWLGWRSDSVVAWEAASLVRVSDDVPLSLAAALAEATLEFSNT